MSPDYLKLFLNRRLNMEDHGAYIQGRLANMKIESPAQYEEYSAFYGVDVEAKVTIIKNNKVVKEKAKKVGRPAKV